MRSLLKFITIGLFIILFQNLSAQEQIINNNALRFGTGEEASVNSMGNLKQPFYFSTLLSAWRQLTYSNYALDMVYAVDGDGTNEWNTNGSRVINPVMTNQTFDASNFTITSGTTGYGTLIVRGDITINGTILSIENKYEVGNNQKYIKTTTRITNNTASPINNLRFWIGTRDDYIGRADEIKKERGNIVNGVFSQITNMSERALALRCSANSEGVLFYTNSSKGNVISAENYSGSNGLLKNFDNVSTLDPTTSIIDQTTDGGYGFYVRLNDLAPGENDDFVWYYAASAESELPSIVNDISSTSISVNSISATTATLNTLSNSDGTGHYIVVPRNATAPTMAQIVAGIDYAGVTIINSGSEALTANINKAFNIVGLVPATNYDVYFVAENVTHEFSEIETSHFITADATPNLTTQAVTDIGTYTANAHGTISNLGISNPTAYGVCWNSTGAPTILNSKVDNGTVSLTGPFIAAMTGLTANTTYYVRAFATNTAGTSYGEEVTFTTPDVTPNISYVTPQTYVVNIPITALTPTNTGGAAVVIASPQVSTFAGSVSGGSADGSGAAASFRAPAFLAMDAAGNIYVSDLVNNMIRKITPGGNVTTLANASTGLNQPAGIAVDPTGNVYVADNQKIRKITPTGVISTLAGSDSGERGNADGVGTAARFNNPVGLALDVAGNLYVADMRNYMIRKITPGGEVSTFAGNGTRGSANGNGSLASFDEPASIVIDASGNMYITDSGNNSIRKINLAGDVTTLAGSGARGANNGAGTAASFNQPFGITVDASGNVYVADTYNNLIRKINLAGNVSTFAGSGNEGADNGAGEIASFLTPYGVTVDTSGNLYVADLGNNLIRKITQSAYTISPALPAGLSLDGATGTISGIPTVVSAAIIYTVATSNSGGSSTATISLAVKNPQTITFDALAAKTYGDATFDLAATSTSGLAVSYSSDNTAVATVSGSTVSIVGAGTANITASQVGDATYVAADNVIKQLTVNKKALTVTATGDTKTYDGTTVSKVNPTVETLATGDEINVAPTQAFDNASVGTTHVLTVSGLTIKKGSTDVTGNYTISYATATGTINKKAVTVTATGDSKTYDGTTVSKVTPAVEPLVAGDEINTAPTQAFDNASVGTTHALTASGLTIKNGSTNVTDNYELSYATATGTINKKAVTVTATGDSKTYDGTTVSKVTPAVEPLVAGDEINTAPTQAFDNAAIGTTRVLTASGLTIKKASTDVTGNYDISYATATGTINKKVVTVTATADTKTYDGTTDSKVNPTVETLAAGDEINTAPTQAFDNIAVGTTHVLTATGLTIKNGSTDVTGNYDIRNVSANGSITAIPLTMTAPTVTLSKVYDGNKVATITTIGTLSGMLASDASNVTVTAVASYDNATIGTNKTITVVYTLGGSAAGNYSAPADYLATGAEISSGTITLEPLSNPTQDPNSTGLILSYSVVTGGPTQYQITFEAAALAVGIQNVSYTALATTNSDGTITIIVPEGTKPGKYKGTLQMRNDSGVESTAYDFVMTVNIPTEYIAVKYNRVLVLDNSTRMFSTYQWYKDGVAIEGATKQFYRDPKGLVGTYTVQATTTDGEILYSYPKVLNIPLALKVTVYPTMVKASQTCTVEITDEDMELNLTGAELSVYSTQGIRVYHSTKVENLNTIKLPIMDGVYSGRVTTADGQSFLFKVIVAN